jgi:nucleotide-binding universal stress UspA family protein
MMPAMPTPPILCAFEDTDASRHAVEAARRLALALDAPVLLVHVFDPVGVAVLPTGDPLQPPVVDVELERIAREGAQRRLEQAAAELAGLDVTPVFAEGRAVSELTRLAAEHEAQLIVTGTAARGALERLVVGSVTSRLAAHAPCPVAAVPPGAALDEPGPVVAAYDGSEHGLRAARFAAGLASRLRRELVLVHVRHRDEEEVTAGPELAGELHAAARAAAAAPGAPEVDLTVHVAVEDGEPVEVVTREARARSAALLVAGTRGRSTLSAALLGSVSTGLVREAGRPVVLVSQAGSPG